jgi:fermentation-respiration switch protein FrsA (DUF1100 family)
MQKIKHLLIGHLTVKGILQSTVVCYFAMTILAFFFSNHLIFFPQPPGYKDSSQIIHIKIDDQTNICAVYLPSPSAKFTILYSHGNAEDIGYLSPIFERYVANGFSVFAYDYRGYGLSDSRPSEKNTYQDIEAAYKYLTENLATDPNRIIALGRSIGSGPATDLATRHKLAALILESSIVSAYRTVTRIPLLPFDKFNNIEKIKNVHCPVLVIHGQKDQTVKFWHGKKMFNAANEPKMSLWIENAGHNDLLDRAGNEYWQTLKTFTTNIRTD